MTVADTRLLEVLGELADGAPKPVVLGICGAQGSGKSTLAAALASRLVRNGRRCATISIDDLYLTKAERIRLASAVHRLCITRGTPGTHDVAMGIDLLDSLREGSAVRLPRFDKARDDRMDSAVWRVTSSHCDVVLFEGWCVGARAQARDELCEPVNTLEADEDRDGVWRRFVNDALAGLYQDLFARIDRLVLLAAPGWEVVHGWRLQQEEDLRASAGARDTVMDDAGIARFVAHYERLTRHILSEMPARADLVVRLDGERRPVSMDRRT